MSRKSKRHTNVPKTYKEPSLTTTPPRKTQIKTNTAYLICDQIIPTIYGLYPQLAKAIQLETDADFIPLKNKGFQVVTKGAEKSRFVNSTLKRANGIEFWKLVPVDSLFEEDYFDTVPGQEEHLKDIGFFSEAQLAKRRISDPRIVVQFKVNDIGYQSPWVICNHKHKMKGENVCRKCLKLKITVHGKITHIDFPTYWAQTLPPLLFEATDPEQSNYNGHIFPCQFDKESNDFHEINLNMPIMNRIRACIKSKSEQYLHSPYIDRLLNKPIDINIESSLFGKYELSMECGHLLNEHSVPKTIMYLYINKLIENAFALKRVEKIDKATKFTTIGKGKQLMCDGIYIDEVSMDTSMMRYLRDDGIVLNYSLLKITWFLTLDWMVKYLNISNVAHKSIRDDSEIRLKSNSTLQFGYNRNHSTIYLSKFEVFPMNESAVRAEKEINNNL